MNTCATKVPVSLGALALGLAGLAHLFGRFAWGGIPSLLVAALSACALVMLAAAAMRSPAAMRQCLSDSTQAAVFSASLYALVMLTALLAPRWHAAAFWMWAVCAGASVAYVAWYTWRHALAMAPQSVNPSILVPYCALGTIALAGERYGLAELRSFLFLFVIVGYVILASVCAWRIRQRPLEPQLHPLTAICSAPLALAALIYLHLDTANTAVSAVLVLASQVIFLLVVASLPRILAEGFRPTSPAMVFPLALNASAAVDGLAVVKALGAADRVIFTFMAYLEVAFALIVACAVVVLLLRNMRSHTRVVPAELAPAAKKAHAIVRV